MKNSELRLGGIKGAGVGSTGSAKTPPKMEISEGATGGTEGVQPSSGITPATLRKDTVVMDKASQRH